MLKSIGLLMVKLMMNLLGLSVLLTLAGLINCLDQQRCRFKLEEIEGSFNRSGNVDNFVLNCLAHNGSYAESISLSVFHDDNSSNDMRYDFQCVGGNTLVPTISSDVSSTSNPACSSCNFTADNPCDTSEYACYKC